jgi:hypothetical protein
VTSGYPRKWNPRYGEADQRMSDMTVQVASLGELEAAFAHELATDRWAASETAYALAVRYRQAWEPGKAGEWAQKAIDLLDELPSDTLEQVATTRVSVGGVTLPSFLHADLVRARHADVM